MDNSDNGLLANGTGNRDFHVRLKRGEELLLDAVIPLDDQNRKRLQQSWSRLHEEPCEHVCANRDCDVITHFALLLECFSKVSSVEELELVILRGNVQLHWQAKAAHVAMTLLLAVLSHSSCPSFNRIAWIWNYVPFPADPDQLGYVLFAYITLLRALNDQDCSSEALRQSLKELSSYFNKHVHGLLQLARKSYREEALDNALIIISTVSRIMDTTCDRQIQGLRQEIINAGAVAGDTQA